MEEMKEFEHSTSQKSSWYRVGTWGAVFIMGYFLITEHQAHVIQYLPYALLLACPFMHIFMHGGHHGYHDHSNNKENS